MEALQARELRIREWRNWQPLLLLCSTGRRAEQVGDQAEGRLEADLQRREGWLQGRLASGQARRRAEYL